MQLAKFIYGSGDFKCRVCGTTDASLYAKVCLPDIHIYLCEECLAAAIEQNIVRSTPDEELETDYGLLELAALVLDQRKQEVSNDDYKEC